LDTAFKAKIPLEAFIQQKPQLYIRKQYIDFVDKDEYKDKDREERLKKQIQGLSISGLEPSHSL
jgi:hypothetical protein